jgi:hypothetical protein
VSSWYQKAGFQRGISAFAFRPSVSRVALQERIVAYEVSLDLKSWTAESFQCGDPSLTRCKFIDRCPFHEALQHADCPPFWRELGGSWAGAAR